jgi:hypothetical protein
MKEAEFTRIMEHWVRISAETQAIVRYVVGFLSPPWQATTASFQTLSNSSFIIDPTIQRYIVYILLASINNPQENYFI